MNIRFVHLYFGYRDLIIAKQEIYFLRISQKLKKLNYLSKFKLINEKKN